MARDYSNNGLKEEAEEMFKEALLMAPENYDVHVEVGWFYKNLGKYQEAEEMFKKATRINPNLSAAYIGLGWLYCHWLGREGPAYKKEEDAFKMAIEVDSSNPEVYVALGAALYTETGRYEDAEIAYRKALEIDPQYKHAYIGLGYNYKDRRRYKDAESLLIEALSIDCPDESLNREVYVKLAECYIEQFNFNEAIKTLQKAIAMDLADERIYRLMAVCLNAQKKYKQAEDYFKKANSNLNAITFYAYNKIKDKLLENRIKMIGVQYPMRNVEVLKSYFSNREEIVFVDNEKIFKEAVNREGYDSFFVDKFAIEFGHCTRKGNRLLAKNIARALLTELNLPITELNNISIDD